MTQPVKYVNLDLPQESLLFAQVCVTISGHDEQGKIMDLKGQINDLFFKVMGELWWCAFFVPLGYCIARPLFSASNPQ